MIEYLKNNMDLELDLSEEEMQVLDNLFKLYKARYLESLDKDGAGTIMKDVHVIDKVYAFFRNKSKETLGHDAVTELLIEKTLSHGKDMLWGSNKNSLSQILYLENESFKQ